MDRPLLAIFAAVAVEAACRVLSSFIAADALWWTFGARVCQVLIIVVLARDSCGVRAASVRRELAVGVYAASGLGAAAILADLFARAALGYGLIGGVLAPAGVDRPVAYVLAACLAGPFAEELFFRGLVYGRLRTRLPAWVCVALTTVLFVFAHPRAGLIQAAGGVLFALLYEWRRTVWPGFVVHAAGNLGLWLLPHIYAVL